MIENNVIVWLIDEKGQVQSLRQGYPTVLIAQFCTSAEAIVLTYHSTFLLVQMQYSQHLHDSSVASMLTSRVESEASRVPFELKAVKSASDASCAVLSTG